MKKKQSNIGNVLTIEQHSYKKSNTGNRLNDSRRDRKVTDKSELKKSVRAKKYLEDVKKEMNENSPSEISKLYKDLKNICIRVEKAEEENQRLFNYILKEVSPRQNRFNNGWVKESWIN